jgi:hypothetical protein
MQFSGNRLEKGITTCGAFEKVRANVDADILVNFPELTLEQTESKMMMLKGIKLVDEGIKTLRTSLSHFEKELDHIRKSSRYYYFYFHLLFTYLLIIIRSLNKDTSKQLPSESTSWKSSSKQETKDMPIETKDMPIESIAAPEKIM